jgi:hypothetical protein
MKISRRIRSRKATFALIANPGRVLGVRHGTTSCSRMAAER